MKVAIIGAGISGLSCAFELKKYGIIPTIFEEKSKLGESLGFGAIMFHMFNRGIKDPFKFLKEYNINLTPNSPLKAITM
jgi:flavin-dependent dehydrogenase